MKKPIVLLTLLFCLLACNLPVQGMPTPTIPPAPTLAPSLTATPASAYPVVDVPVQAIQVSDDDGSHRNPIAPDEVSLLVQRANEIWARAGIHLVYDPKTDFASLNSTLLNRMTGMEDSNWVDEVLYGDKVGREGYPGRLMLYFRWGGDPNTPTGGGFSSMEYNFIAMPAYTSSWVCDHRGDTILAHELGHYMGLAHTFAPLFSTEPEAAQYLKDHNNDPAVFDGDGFGDTFPDPGVYDYRNQCALVETMTLNGIVFPLPRDNIMSYYEMRTEDPVWLSDQQIERLRWVLSKRLEHNIATPTNLLAPSPLEANKLSVLSIANCSTDRQEMTSWGPYRWYNGDQFFVSSDKNCVVSLGLPVSQAGKYRLDLYLTRSPDFGVIQVSLDGTPIGGPIDLYAPYVMPTDAIPAGAFDLAQKTHTLTFTVVGINDKSHYYSFGLDCFSLVPQP